MNPEKNQNAGQWTALKDRLDEKRAGRKNTERLSVLATKVGERLQEKLRRLEENSALSQEQKEEQMKKLGVEMEVLADFAGDITDLLTRTEQEGEIDHISGLVKQPAFVEFYELALEYLPENEQVVMVSFDLDKFKIINDTIGHQQADVLLRRIGGILHNHLRPDDRACRIGGDEFVLFLNHIKIQDKTKMTEEVTNIMSRVAEMIHREVAWKDSHGKENHITLSIGCMESGQGRPYFDKLREESDGAALASKHAGRNRITFINDQNKYEAYVFNPAMADAAKGKNGYQFDKLVDAKEAHKSRRSCEAEVDTSMQRVKEEIERFVSEADGEKRKARETVAVLAKILDAGAEIPESSFNILAEYIISRMPIDWNKMTLGQVVDCLYLCRQLN